MFILKENVFNIHTINNYSVISLVCKPYALFTIKYLAVLKFVVSYHVVIWTIFNWIAVSVLFIVKFIYKISKYLHAYIGENNKYFVITIASNPALIFKNIYNNSNTSSCGTSQTTHIITMPILRDPNFIATNDINWNSSDFNYICLRQPNSDRILELANWLISICSTENAGCQTSINNNSDSQNGGSTIVDSGTIAADTPADLQELALAQVNYIQENFYIRSPFQEYLGIYSDKEVTMYMCQVTSGLVIVFIFVGIVIIVTNFIENKGNKNKLLYDSFYFNFIWIFIKTIQITTFMFILFNIICMFLVSVEYINSMK